MSKRITWAILGMVVASLVLAGIGTFVFARVANRTKELARLEQQARAIADLAPPGIALGATADPTATTTVVTTTSPPVSIPRTPRQRQAERRAAQASARRAERQGEQSQLRSKIAAIVQLTGVTEVTVLPDGTVVGDLPAGVESGQLDAAALRGGDALSGSRTAVLWAAAGRTTAGGNLLVVVITTRQEAIFGPTMRWFVIFAAVAIGAGAAVSWWLGRRLARPVQAAVETTQRIAAGDLSARLSDRHTSDPEDELAVLARSINSMANELDRSRGLERQFLMSVSHDLRTPLTSIRGYAEAISDGMADDPRRAADVIVAESQRLERLVGDLLDLAKLDAHRFSFEMADASVADVIAAAVGSIQPEAAAAGIHLAIDEGMPFTVRVDRDRLAQAIGNLSSNALRYARSTVWIRARAEGSGVSIDVADDGAGIPTADLPHVFERLYQASNTPERRESGSGLGLAIVKELVEAMGGTVGVASEPGAGTTFTLRLPAVRSEVPRR